MILKLSRGILLVFTLCAVVNSASAQISIWSVDAGKYMGKFIRFDELVNKVKYNPNSRTCFIMLADPDAEKSPTITVVFHNVRSLRYVHWLQSLEIQTVTISGVLLKEKGKFIINGDDNHTKIEEEKGGETLTHHLLHHPFNLQIPLIINRSHIRYTI